jgi:hypothetical protein
LLDRSLGLIFKIIRLSSSSDLSGYAGYAVRMGWYLNTLGCVAYVVVIADEMVLVYYSILETSQPILKGYSSLADGRQLAGLRADKFFSGKPGHMEKMTITHPAS